MGDREQAVAGVPSQRLSQLASPQLVQRTRRDNALGQAHSAFKDEMSAILRPCQPCNSSRRNTPRDKMTPQGYAGKSTAELNNAIFHHGSKKKSPEANKSDQMAFLFSCAKNSSQPPYRGGTRSLKQYVAADQLPQAFCTKFQVTDPLSGRTEIMTARRPGKASAEINLSNFDSYMLPKERTFSLKKAKDNIDHSILGLMPKKSKELKFCVRTIARQQQLPTLECKENWMTPTAAANVCRPLGLSKRHRLPTLECRENWMTPTAAANVCRPLGLSKRHSAFPWTPSDTDNIAHTFGGAVVASPRTTRACIRPAFIS
ncbi:hypothetical protein, conserved [Eimeria praecox]|uniref:Uncharacterized protein n=1 Tax=Eimeria praecox TaxID=51316 RepID=U6GZT1_9EIME|nr:hypothetical protein, conserved [Eimeria praecox]